MGLNGQMHLFFEDIATRKGRERYLGIPANQNARVLRERAVVEFRKRHSEFKISGDTTDFDGYVQFLFNGIKHCAFYEGVIRCRKARDHYAHELGYGNCFYQLTLGEPLPIIRDLIAEDERIFVKKLEREKYLVNIVLAQIWLDQLFSDSTKESQSKSMIKEGVLELIRANEIPFSSIPEIMNYGYFTEYLVVSRLMLKLGVVLPFENKLIKLSPVGFDSFEQFKSPEIDFESTPPIKLSVDRWCRYFLSKHNIDVNCFLCLGIDSWV